jgi:hypothetical protein
MLGREVIEGQQRLDVIGHLGHRLGPLGAVVGSELGDCLLGVLAVLSAADLGQRPPRPGVHALGQRGQHVGGLVDPATLGSGGGEHIAQRRPQPKGTIADRQHRRLHAAPAQLAQQLRPRLGRLPQPVGDPDQLLGPVGPHPDDDQGA